MAFVRRLFVRLFFVVVVAGLGSGIGIFARSLFRSDSAEVAQVVEPKELPASDNSSDLSPGQEPPAEVYMTGWVSVGRKINVVLSDGRIYTENHPDLEGVFRTRAVIAGSTFWLKSAPRAQVVQADPLTSPVPSAPSSPPSSSVASLGPTAGSWLLDNDGVYRLRDRESIR